MGDAILRIPRDARVRAYRTRDTYDGVVPATSKRQPYCHSSYIELSGCTPQNHSVPHITRCSNLPHVTSQCNVARDSASYSRYSCHLKSLCCSKFRGRSFLDVKCLYSAPEGCYETSLEVHAGGGSTVSNWRRETYAVSTELT